MRTIRNNAADLAPPIGDQTDRADLRKFIAQHAEAPADLAQEKPVSQEARALREGVGNSTLPADCVSQSGMGDPETD